MKVAVLTAGRSGSMSLYQACGHIQNYTTGHDSGSGELAQVRTLLKDRHIEIDTRFAWLLGRLSESNADDVYYVFLTRDGAAIAKSYDQRWQNRKGIIRGYCEAILQRDKPDGDLDLAIDLVETIEANIRVFLKDKRHSVIHLEMWQDDIPRFFREIEAEVDLDAALAAFGERHNASRRSSAFVRARFRVSRLVDKLEVLLRRFGRNGR